MLLDQFVARDIRSPAAAASWESRRGTTGFVGCFVAAGVPFEPSVWGIESIYEHLREVSVSHRDSSGLLVMECFKDTTKVDSSMVVDFQRAYEFFEG